MKLLNVPPVKPGQKFKYSIGRTVYDLISVRWDWTWKEWRAEVKIEDEHCTFDILIAPDASLEILND